MSKYRFNPLALLNTSSPSPRNDNPTQAPPPASSPRWGQHDEAHETLTPTMESAKRCPSASANEPGEPTEEGPACLSPAYVQALKAAFADAGYPDAKPKDNVLTFRQWMRRDRCVMKGQKGVRVEILVPRGRPARLLPRSIFLFHVSQTRPLAEPPAPPSAPPTTAPQNESSWMDGIITW